MNRSHIYLLALGVFLTAVVELVIAGILSVMADDLHISIAAAGQLITAYSIAFAILTPILVMMTARIGRKKLLLGSLAFFMLGCAASFTSTQFYVLLLARLVLGASAGVYIVIAMSSMAKLVPVERLGSAMGTIALAFSSAMVLGVPMGIAIANWWNWQAIFGVLGLVSLLVTLGLLRFLPDSAGDPPVTFRKQFAVLGNPVILGGLLLAFFLNAGFSLMYTYLTPYMQTVLHLNVSAVAGMMLTLGIFGMIGSRLGGYGVDKWGTARIIAISLAVQAAALALQPAAASLPAVALALFTVWVFAMFVCAPGIQSYFIQQAPQSSGLVLSLNLSVTHLGIAIGAGAGGMATEGASTVSYNPWLAAGVTVLGLAAAGYSFSRSGRGASASGTV